MCRGGQAVGRLYVNKANLVAMNAQLTEQLGMVKVAGTLQQSTQVTTLVNNLMRAPELQQTVVQMQKEMMKVALLMPLPSSMHLCLALVCIWRVCLMTVCLRAAV